MNDFERALSDALKKASDDYRPTDAYAAKERFLHRLRRRQLFFTTAGVGLAGAAAVIAGLFVFARDAVPPERAEPLPPAAALTEELPDVAVGERPSGVAFGDDAVWVANSADGTVMVIDPVGRQLAETIDVGGDPDDVAVGVGAAWVSDSGAGTIAKVPLPSSGEPLKPIVFEVGEPGSTHMDVAPGVDALWVAKDDSVFRVDPTTNDARPIPTIESPTDIAAGEGAVYVLGESEVARLDPVSEVVTHLADIVPSRNQDMAFQDGYLWIANGDEGEVTRVDAETGDTSSPIFVGGNFSGISVEEDAVWVISGGASEEGVLTRIDPDTLAVRGPRAELHGRPYDITTGAGFVWIANLSASTVSGLDPAALPGGPEEEGGLQGDPVFLFSADGDLWIETFEGRLTQLTDTQEQERFPSISEDGRYVAYVRGTDVPVDAQEVVVLDVTTSETVHVDTGWSPSFGPDDRIAYVRPKGGDVEIVVASVREGQVTETVAFEAIAGYGAPNRADNLTWDLTGDFVYYSAGWEGSSLFQAAADGTVGPFELIPNNHERFATYFAPSVRSDNSVHVIRVCCQRFGDVPRTQESLELGVIRFTEGGPSYERVVALDPRQIPVAAFSTAPELDSAGNLTLDVEEGRRGWRHTVTRTWLVGTTGAIWLVDASDEPGIQDTVYVSDAFFNDLGDFTVAGLATFPEFDD